MDRTYFERLHRQEARDAEWRLVDEAFKTDRRQRHAQRIMHGLRRRVGGWLISIGTRIEGTSIYVAPCTCLEDTRPPQI